MSIKPGMALKYIKFLFGVSILIIASVYEMQALHIIGGDVTYECMGIDTDRNMGRYQIIMTVYRDCQGGGANFDGQGASNPAKIGIYRQRSSGAFQHLQTFLESPDEITKLDPVLSPCVGIPPGICVEEGVYIFEVELPISEFTYSILYQRCCRNTSVANLVNVDDTGASFGVEISPQAQSSCNSSPKFEEFPPILVCLDQALFASQAAVDKDGDVLVYEFCSPKQGGGPVGSNSNPGNDEACNGIRPNPAFCPPPLANVIFKQPFFSASEPIPGDPPLSIDGQTGLITGVPNLQGQYVVGVCVKEYRNGVLIGQINRDFQFNILDCEARVVASIAFDAQIGPKEYIVNSCGDFSINFKNESEDERYIDSYLWEFVVSGDTVISEDRDASIVFPGTGFYTGQMVINPGSPDRQCTDTAYFNVNVFPEIEAAFTVDYDSCQAGPIKFRDFSASDAGPIFKWDWDFGDGEISELTNPNHQYKSPGVLVASLLVADVNECKDSMTQEIVYQPAPVVTVEPSSFFGCIPLEITFDNRSFPIDESYDFFWDFGDGETSSDLQPVHTYRSSGSFDVMLSIMSPNGCEAERRYVQLINIEDNKPTADFSFTPELPNSIDNIVQFSDRSINAVRWFWTFGDEGVAFEPNPTFNFRDTGIYDIKLIVFHPSGCTDTLMQRIDIEPKVVFYMPNAFTPNADGDNDLFLGKGILDGIHRFSLIIANRWGEVLFETDDPYEGWDGTSKNSGVPLPPAVYIYKLNYVGPRGEVVKENGFATLVR